ncbi:DUF1294 domain-containing protein [Rhizobium sp. G187]|uniref:DUF1294 domain-containing protein n=1 Tax=Rhizobium sp. G187 TaxID=3451352 RepID=UPI003EE7E212
MTDALTAPFALPFPAGLLPIWLLAGWNVFVLGLFAVDKIAAIRQTWRVPERKLISCIVLFGSGGALIGQRLFRHKTRKPPFTWLIPTMLILHMFVVATGVALVAFTQNS